MGSLSFRTTLMWQRPTRITMGCKFVVVSNFWKSRRRKEFSNDYRMKLKCFLPFDIILWTLLIVNRTWSKNVRNSSSISSSNYCHLYDFMFPRRFQFHSCFLRWITLLSGKRLCVVKFVTNMSLLFIYQRPTTWIFWPL